MKILEEFWYGNIQPNEKSIPAGSKHAKLLQLVVQNEDALIPLLSEEAKEVFDKFRGAQDELSSINECDAFVLGFRLGGRFMLEVMENMDIPFIDE